MIEYEGNKLEDFVQKILRLIRKKKRTKKLWKKL